MEVEPIKVVIIGDARVGKSSILSRYITNTFQEHITPTLGAAYYTKVLDSRGKQIKLNIWDTAGQERYHSLAKIYSRDAKVVILVYDITDRGSYDGMKRWYSTLIKEGLGPNCLFCIFGNKEDLISEEKIPLEEAKTFSNSINAVYKKTSAKLNIGIDEGFQCLSDHIAKSVTLKSASSFRLEDANSTLKPMKSSRCC